ncbi:hypothetical protein WAI453_003348 [Rhynchosporium graminicola]
MLLLAFSALPFGYKAGSFTALLPRFAMVLREDPDAVLTFFRFFEFEKGLGMVLAKPTSAALMGGRVRVEGYDLLRWQRIVLFVGDFLVGSSFRASYGSLGDRIDELDTRAEIKTSFFNRTDHQ